MVDDTRVAAALSRLPVEDAAGGIAGGGGGEVGASEGSVGLPPRQLVDWPPGSGDGVASRTGVLLRSTCRAYFGQTLPSKCIKVVTAYLNCHLSSVQLWFRLPPAHDALLGLVVDVVLLLLQPERLRLCYASPSGQVCRGANACLQGEINHLRVDVAPWCYKGVLIMGEKYVQGLPGLPHPFCRPPRPPPPPPL